MTVLMLVVALALSVLTIVELSVQQWHLRNGQKDVDAMHLCMATQT